MTRPSLPRALLLLLVAAMTGALVFGPSPAIAGDDEAPTVPGPRDLPPDDAPKPAPEAKEKPEAPEPVVRFDPKDFELLPISDIERIELARANPGLVYRVTVLARRAEKIERQYAERKNKQDDGSKKLAAEIERVRGQVAKVMATAMDAVRPYGVDEHVLELIAAAPREGPYRIERYAHSLVLALPDLTDAQRSLFERLVTEVNSAYFTLGAQQKRMELTAKQAEIEKDDAAQLRRTVDQQLRLMDKRFWQVVDYVLTEDQRVALKGLLPSKFTRVADAIRHLYALPGITPAQGTRIQSIITEVEAESAPDQALVKRNQARLKQKDLPADERKVLEQENKDAYARLQDLQLYSSKTIKGILTEAQYQAYLAIPPGISENERKQRAKRLLENVPLTAEQEAAMKELEVSYREEARQLRDRVRDIQRKGADYGPDSPQMGMMQMEMASVAAEGETVRREAIGRIFMDILTADQVSGWTLGFYGQMR